MNWFPRKVGWRLLSVVVGLLVAGLIATAFGRDPAAFYRALAVGAFGSWSHTLTTLAKVTPLLLAGLAVAVPLRAGLFNIGAEGQMCAGALASVTVVALAGPADAAVMLPLVILAGIAAGAAWGAVAGFLKSRCGVHEVISTIMLNFIALYTVAYLVNTGPLADPSGVGRTPEIPPSARLPLIFESGPHGLSVALVIALAAWLVAWWFVVKSVTGFRMRVAGANPLAAGRKGINVRRMTLVAMAVGGGLAGLGGVLEVCGVQYSLSVAFSPGYGFDGIAVALVAGGYLIGVPVAALFFAAVRAAGTSLQLDAGLSPQMIYVIEAVVVIAAAVPAAPRMLARLSKQAQSPEDVLPADESPTGGETAEGV